MAIDARSVPIRIEFIDNQKYSKPTDYRQYNKKTSDKDFSSPLDFYSKIFGYPNSFWRSSNLNSKLQIMHFAWFLLAATNKPPQLGHGMGKGFFQDENSHSG